MNNIKNDSVESIENLHEHDHRRIGKELNLFSFSKLTGIGCSFSKPPLILYHGLPKNQNKKYPPNGGCFFIGRNNGIYSACTSPTRRCLGAVSPVAQH